jgi:recombination associated protein RdgC
MIKNATIYRIAPGFAINPSAADEAMAKYGFVECGPTQQASSGWIAPRAEHGALVESIDGQLILRLRTDVRKVPADAVAKRADEIADQIEQQTGRKPGKKQRKELKEQALHELLPMAFVKAYTTWVWIDRASGLILVNTASPTRADHVITMLIKTLDGLSISPIHTEMSPAVAMAHWLGTGEAPYSFSIDRECELKSCDELKSVVKYGRHPLCIDQVREHITQGKVPTRLALTWRDRVSFVLSDSGVLRKLAFLDVVFENKQRAPSDEAFDADVAIMTGEMRQLIPDLIEALGGEHALPELKEAA